MIFKNIEKVMGLQQPAGGIRPETCDFETGLVSRHGDFPNF